MSQFEVLGGFKPQIYFYSQCPHLPFNLKRKTPTDAGFDLNICVPCTKEWYSNTKNEYHQKNSPLFIGDKSIIINPKPQFATEYIFSTGCGLLYRDERNEIIPPTTRIGPFHYEVKARSSTNSTMLVFNGVIDPDYNHPSKIFIKTLVFPSESSMHTISHGGSFAQLVFYAYNPTVYPQIFQKISDEDASKTTAEQMTEQKSKYLQLLSKQFINCTTAIKGISLILFQIN